MSTASLELGHITGDEGAAEELLLPSGWGHGHSSPAAPVLVFMSPGECCGCEQPELLPLQGTHGLWVCGAFLPIAVGAHSTHLQVMLPVVPTWHEGARGPGSPHGCLDGRSALPETSPPATETPLLSPPSPAQSC